MKYVICLSNNGYEAALEKRKVYQVNETQSTLPDYLISIIDESGDDYIFDASMFAPINIDAKLEAVLYSS